MSRRRNSPTELAELLEAGSWIRVVNLDRDVNGLMHGMIELR